MANRYGTLVGSKKISEDFQTINVGFDRVQAEMDTKGTPADAQAKADAAKAAAIATAAEALAAHRARGADEHPAAKGNVAGFMSAADKLLVDARTSTATPDTLMQRDAAGRAKVAAPAAADDIARKAETDAVQTKLDSHAADTVKHVTQAEHDKLTGIAAGAEVNQNAFSKINDVSAGSKTDTVTFVGGTGITVTTNPTTKQVTVTATGEATPGAHAPSHLPGGTDVIPDAVTGGLSGLMSGADAKFVRQDGETKTGAQAKADAAEEAAKDYTDQKVGEIVIDDASLTQKGIVQLSDAADSPATDKAATPSAVKSVNDGIVAHTAGTSVHGAVSAATASRLIIRDTAGRAQVAAPSAAADIARLDTVTGQVGVLSGLQTTAKTNAVAAINEVFQSGVSAKQGVVDAINAMGGSASTSDSWSTLATKIKAINTGKKYATGLITSPTAAIQFPNFNDINYGAYPLLVTGLTFRPTVVVVTRQVLGTRDVSTYTFAFNNGSPNESGTTFNYCSVLNTAQGNILEFLKINEYTGTGSNARGYMNDTSFRLPVTVAGVSYRWEAFG